MACKAQLRLTTQRLGQLQEKQHSQRQITSHDIAILLRQGNIALARAKTQNLIQEDTFGALLEVLELYVRLILEHFNEIDQRCHYCPHFRDAADFICSPTPTPVVVEAASTIIFASPHAGSRGISFA
jgi:Regulator of Vps4 activity in the MVB pathway